MYLSLSLSLYLYLSLYLLKKCERVAVKGCIDQFHAMGLRKCQSTNRKYDIEKYSWWKSRNPSRREASRKGGESSGGPSLGDCDNICEGNLLFRVIFGKFMHRWFLICAQLGSYNVSFLNYRPPKLKYGFFRGSFARLTSQSQAGTLSRRHRMRNILLETSSRCYDCNKHIAEQINVQHFLPMILFVNYNSCMCFQDIFCIISHKTCVSLQLQRWINSTLRNNEKSTAVLLRECHPLFTSE